jgi:Uncharacterized protein conserved in bacteria
LETGAVDFVIESIEEVMKEKRFGYLNLLSIISAFSVITLHVNSVFWEYSSEGGYWISALIIESALYFAVPVFFMISGATLLDFYERYSTGIYFKKRLMKTVVPFLFWSIVGLLVHIFAMKDISAGDLTVRSVFNGLMSFNSYVSVFWFFRPLFIAYLAIPLFAGVEKSRKLHIFKYLAVAALLLDFLMPFLNRSFKLNIYPNLTTLVGSYYLIFILLGYIFHNVELSKAARAIIYLGGLIGFGFQCIGTYVLSEKAGAVDATFKEYTNIPAILQGAAVFVFFKYAYRFIENRDKTVKVIGILKEYTFSFFLLHWFVIEAIVRFTGVDKYSLVWRLMGFIPVALICVAVTWILRKLKIGRLILP